MTGPERERHDAYVGRLFGSISNRYDLLNRLISFGMDQSWRRHAVAECRLPPNGRLLDAATGTGDMTLEALRQYPHANISGLDLTAGMLHRAQEKAAAGLDHSLRLLQGNALDLPFPDNHFDAAISGFMMRNVGDVNRAFAEQVRVVKPGGRVICLEITRPAVWPASWIFWVYFYGLVPLLGSLISGRPQAYTYLPRSVSRFFTAHEVQDIMEKAGLREVRFRLLKMHSIAVHTGVKRP
jgi:demethylmenaquinone methyltransferase/2-methoxy-6-polyprenyl-1,4-benzoquinol methylase